MAVNSKVQASTQRFTTPFAITRLQLACLLTLVLIVGLVGFWLGSTTNTVPVDKSPEVGFARDMIFHHSNAVALALILRDRTEDEAMRVLAVDILLTQQNQIGQMQGWLDVWGVPVAAVGPAMAWMGMSVDGLMPGMATPEEMKQLNELHGVEADVAFLNLMIAHHQSGIDMAHAIRSRSNRSEVEILAQSIIISQESELTYMRDLLMRKGAVPSATPTAESDSMPGMNH